MAQMINKLGPEGGAENCHFSDSDEDVRVPLSPVPPPPHDMIPTQRIGLTDLGGGFTHSSLLSFPRSVALPCEIP